jgi:hypothetical protein
MTVTINGSTGIAGVDGSAGTPSVQGADTNTGMFFPAADTIAFAEGGVEAMRIDSSGNVGIGTSSPGNKLHVVSATGQVDNDGLIRAEYSGSSTPVNASFVAKNYHGTSQFMQWENYGLRIGTRSSTNGGAGAVIFTTNDAERARIDASGNLLVGTTSSLSPSGVGTTGLCVRNTSNNGGWEGSFISTGASSNRGIVINYSGATPNDGFNEAIYFVDSTSARFVVKSNGGISNYSANNTNLSDQRVKKDIQLAGSYLDKICAIPVKTFLYKDQTDNELNLGVIAQEVEAVAPELVDVEGFGETPEDGVPLKTIYQTDLQYALMKCIQELKAQNDELKARVEALEAK